VLEMLSVEETAERLGLHEETVRRFAREGRIPAFKAGRSWRFSEEALAEWVKRQSQSGHTPPCVLIVDDESEIRNFVAVVLEAEGFRVVGVDSPDAGVERLKQDPPDIVILDLIFHGQRTGIPVISHIRAAGLHIPVIVASGYPDSALMHEAMSYAPLIALAKPLTSAMLVEAAQTAVQAIQPLRLVREERA
jgi:excisionase family DNA binding protein